MTSNQDTANLGTTRQSLAIMLLRAREEVMTRFRPMLRDIDVTEQQWRVLRVLAEGGEMDASTIGTHAAILGPSLTRILKSLREKGLIDLRRDAVDGRRTLASLTSAGTALIDTAAITSKALYAEITDAFGADRMAGLLQELDALIETLAKDR